MQNNPQVVYSRRLPHKSSMSTYKTSIMINSGLDLKLTLWLLINSVSSNKETKKWKKDYVNIKRLLWSTVVRSKIIIIGYKLCFIKQRNNKMKEGKKIKKTEIKLSRLSNEDWERFSSFQHDTSLAQWSVHSPCDKKTIHQNQRREEPKKRWPLYWNNHPWGPTRWPSGQVICITQTP